MASLRRARRLTLSAVLVALLALFLAGCGSNGDDPQADLPPAALDGRKVARTNGCSACHGSNGEGGVGPAFVGLFGSEVSIQGGESVIADRDYLVESIRDPSAKLVEGYNLPMPTTKLSDDEIDDVIAYIEALAEVEP